MPRSVQSASLSPGGSEPKRPALDRQFVTSYRRRRIMDAVAEVTAEQGYAATSISDIVRRARVARKTLYECFGGKEELFLATFDAAVEEALGRVEEAGMRATGGWPEQVRAALAAFLGYVAEQPALARMCMLEAPSAAPAMSERYEGAMRRFVTLLAAIAPHGEELPETIDETLIGGVAWIVHRQIRRDEAESALDLLPELSEFLLAPFVASGA
jgi:AcrR family transcriptional regulator